jgi:hypothetical protein
MRYVEETRGNYKGFEYSVIFHGFGHRCGYVCIPEGHKLYENEDSDTLGIIECHGGITFSDFNENLDPDKWWIGFDCAHYNDIMDIESTTKYFGEAAAKDLAGLHGHRLYPGGHLWTLDECIEECKHIIDQICEV